MKRQITLHNLVVDYSVRISTRAKRLRLAVYSDENFVVTVPNNFPIQGVDKYIVAKSQWVIDKLKFFEELNAKQKLTLGESGLEIYKEKAQEVVTSRLDELNSLYFNYKFNKVIIKNHKTVWGSCSKKRNLNFNYKILFLAPKIRDYIIVHELCHLKEPNHSDKFWKLVGKAFPNYSKITEELKIKGLSIS